MRYIVGVFSRDATTGIFEYDYTAQIEVAAGSGNEANLVSQQIRSKLNLATPTKSAIAIPETGFSTEFVSYKSKELGYYLWPIVVCGPIIARSGDAPIYGSLANYTVTIFDNGAIVKGELPDGTTWEPFKFGVPSGVTNSVVLQVAMSGPTKCLVAEWLQPTASEPIVQVSTKSSAGYQGVAYRYVADGLFKRGPFSLTQNMDDGTIVTSATFTINASTPTDTFVVEIPQGSGGGVITTMQDVEGLLDILQGINAKMKRFIVR